MANFYSVHNFNCFKCSLKMFVMRKMQFMAETGISLTDVVYGYKLKYILADIILLQCLIHLSKSKVAMILPFLPS